MIAIGMSVPLIKKAERAVQVARLILGKGADAQEVEDQAVSLMYLPGEELEKMHKRMSVVVHGREARRKR